MDKFDNDTIKEYVLNNRMLLAIKHYGDLTGCGLTDSKKFVEELRDELIKQYPEKFNVPEPSAQQYQNDRIRSREDLVNAVSEVTNNFEVLDFGPIPMGWAADMVIDHNKYCLYSHRFDLSCYEYCDENKNEILLPLNLENLTEKQIVQKYIEHISVGL